MKILISNDDGIFSKGIEVLQTLMRDFGDVMTVAPLSDQSGMAHALTLNRPLRVQKLKEDQYLIDGTPADCVHFAIQDLYQGKKPDLIISGINHGANLGEDVWYSGTVGAAIEGSLMGIRSVAISLVSYETSEFHFDPVAHFVKTRLKTLLEMGSKNPDIIYNINIPSLKQDSIEDIRFTRLGSRRYKSTLVSKLDPRGKVYFWIGGEKLEFDHVEGTDSNAIRNKAISITPIQLNITDNKHLEEMKTWAF